MKILTQFDFLMNILRQHISQPLQQLNWTLEIFYTWDRLVLKPLQFREPFGIRFCTVPGTIWC